MLCDNCGNERLFDNEQGLCEECDERLGEAGDIFYGATPLARLDALVPFITEDQWVDVRDALTLLYYKLDATAQLSAVERLKERGHFDKHEIQV